MVQKEIIDHSIAISKSEQIIPVVMAADNNYAYPMIVAIASLLDTAESSTTYKLYLLISEDFSEENKKYIEDICSNKVGCSCRFIEMNKAYDDINMVSSRITKATYYRLSLPSLLQDIKECIYLDVDIVVKEDLASMFRTFSDDMYIAGVRAFSYLRSKKDRELHRCRLGIEYLDDYVNAGVLLINLDKIRQDKLDMKFQELLKKNFGSQDQDILNVACFGRIQRLEFKYNVMTKYPICNDQAYKSSYLNELIAEEEWEEGRKNPVIIHYADKNKPWNDFSTPYAQNWWDVVQILPNNLAEKIARNYIFELLKTSHKIEQTRMDMGKKLKTTEKKLHESLARENNLKCSISYKIGRVITYIPRKVRQGFHGNK